MDIQLEAMGEEEKDPGRPDITEHLLVEAHYWINKEGRTKQALTQLHNALFPEPASVPSFDPGPDLDPGSGSDSDSAPDPAAPLIPALVAEVPPAPQRDARDEAARHIWSLIKKKPASPKGPLSLEAVSQAILVGADFSDPSDRRAFFDFIATHPGRFREDFIRVFKRILQPHRLPENVDKPGNEGAPVSIPDPSAEYSLLERIWIPGLQNKIKQAMSHDDFIRDLFYGIPDLLQSLKGEEHDDDYIPQLAFKYPGVVGAALHHNDLGYLLGVLNQNNPEAMTHLLLQPMAAYTEPVNAEGEYPVYTISDLITRDVNESAFQAQALIHQLESLDQSKPHIIFSVAKLMEEGMSYYARYGNPRFKRLIKKLASADFFDEPDRVVEGEGPDKKMTSADYAELRFRLYHPVCIRQMHEVWRANFEAFELAAGDKNQFLTHLISNMRDPIAFVNSMLDSKAKIIDFYPETEDDVRNRITYFRDRLDIVMAALGKIPGKQAQKARNKLLSLSIPATDVVDYSVKSVRELLRARVDKLIQNYANTTEDPGEKLLAVLDDNFTRGKCKLTQAQVSQLLCQNTSDLPRHNSRFELIIARDDYLWSLGKASIPSMHPTMRAFRFPYLAARIELEEHRKVGLMSYVETEFPDNKKSPTSKIAKDYLVATKEAFWREVDPYARYPVQALIHRWMPNVFGLGEFFEVKKKQLATFSPIFRMRLAWDALSTREKEDNNITSFEAYIQREQAVVWTAPSASDLNLNQESVVTHKEKEGFARVMADAARGDAVFESFKISHEQDERPAGGFDLDFAGATAQVLEAASDLNRKEKEMAYTPYDLSLLENPTRLDAFLASVDTPSKVKVAKDFILSIDIQSLFQRPGTIMALTAEQVLRFMLVKELPTEEEKRQGYSCHQLAKDLVLKRPELIREILLSQEPRVKSQIPHAMKVLESIILELDYRSLDSEVLYAFLSLQPKGQEEAGFALFKRDINLLRVLMAVRGTLSHEVEDTLSDYIAKILQDSEREESLLSDDLMLTSPRVRVAEKLTLEDLMQMQKVSQGTFDEFIKGDNVDAARCRQLLAPILLSLPPQKIMGFNKVFKAEPGYLLGCLSRLDEQELHGLTEVHEDIFQLQYHEGLNHPLLDFLASEDQPCDPSFLLRCMRSHYEPLAELMRDVLVKKQPLESRYELLTTILTDPGCHEGVLDLITRGPSNPIVAALKSSDFVGRYLKNDQNGFEEKTRALWSTLCRSESVVGYLESNQCLYDANATDNNAEFYLPAVYAEYQLSVLEEPVAAPQVKTSASRYRFDHGSVASGAGGIDPPEARRGYVK